MNKIYCSDCCKEIKLSDLLTGLGGCVYCSKNESLIKDRENDNLLYKDTIKKQFTPNTRKEDYTFYVCMTDKFLSGWGRCEGKINKFIVVCDTHQEALKVVQWAEERKEMKYINLTDKIPYYNNNNYLVSIKNFKEMGVFK